MDAVGLMKATTWLESISVYIPSGYNWIRYNTVYYVTEVRYLYNNNVIKNKLKPTPSLSDFALWFELLN